MHNYTLWTYIHYADWNNLPWISHQSHFPLPRQTSTVIPQPQKSFSTLQNCLYSLYLWVLLRICIYVHFLQCLLSNEEFISHYFLKNLLMKTYIYSWLRAVCFWRTLKRCSKGCISAPELKRVLDIYSHSTTPKSCSTLQNCLYSLSIVTYMWTRLIRQKIWWLCHNAWHKETMSALSFATKFRWKLLW